MEFRCLNSECKAVFRPHRFIALRHPSQAKCPKCGTKGKIIKRGAEIRRSIFHAINRANAEAAETFKDEIKALKVEEQP